MGPCPGWSIPSSRKKSRGPSTTEKFEKVKGSFVFIRCRREIHSFPITTPPLRVVSPVPPWAPPSPASLLEQPESRLRIDIKGRYRINFLGYGPDVHNLTIDLGKSYAIYALLPWHYHAEGRIHKDVSVRFSDDPEFKSGVKIILITIMIILQSWVTRIHRVR